MKRPALAVALVVVVAGVLSAEEKLSDKFLAKEDRALLLSLIGKPLVDPTGKEYCRVSVVARDCWGTAANVEVAAWHEPGRDGKPGRIWFADGDSMAAPKDVKPADLAAETRQLLAPPPPGEEADGFDEPFRRMRRIAAGSAGGVPSLARAAWFVKQGHDGMAALIMDELHGDDSRFGDEPEDEPEPEKLVRRLKSELAWQAYADTVHAFMQHADDEALRHAQRLNRQYPDFIDEFGDGKALLAELQRRQLAKTLNQPAPEKPAEFERWEQPKKIAWLIEQLDQVDVRQFSQPGGVDLAGDWRIEALIAIGDPAVESLIDVIEKDRRLTRSVHFWRDFAQSRTVLSVREAALTAVMSIIRIRAFDPASTGDNFTSRGDEEAVKTAAALRRYWKKFGSLPLEARLLKTLVDETSSVESLREAAENIALIGARRTLGTTVFSDTAIDAADAAKRYEAILKFDDPTAGVAILTALDHDLAHHDKQPHDELSDYHRRNIEETYLHALRRLGDKRIAGELRRRAETAKTLRLRCNFALVAHLLGEPEPLAALADEFKAGRIALPANDRSGTNWDDQPGTIELANLVRAFAWAETPAADAALLAMIDARHPAHALAVEAVRTVSVDWDDDAPWFGHSFCVKLLRADLDDTTKTGAIAAIVDDGAAYQESSDRSTSTGSIPDVIANPLVRNDRVELRRCDEAAAKIHQLVLGLPEYHPLLKDAPARLTQMRTKLDKTMGPLRRATPKEREQRKHSWGPLYVVE